MPTTRPRHTITETEEIAAALRDAAAAWPAENARSSRLLAHLIEEGHQALRERQENRRRAIERSSGAFSSAYSATYLEDLREDWPA